VTTPLDDVEDPFDTDPQDTGPDEIKPRPATPLSELIGVRPPWSWSNLDEDQARLLDSQLQEWIGDYNQHLTTSGAHVIPGCWRQHPALLQTVPVLYWAWWNTHRNPEAGVQSAVEFHQRDLPAFQERLDGLLVSSANASKCRAGRHPAAPDADKTRLDAVTRAATADATQRGPDVIDELLRTTFGAAPPEALTP